jgi:hypothetical protein
MVVELWCFLLFVLVFGVVMELFPACGTCRPPECIPPKSFGHSMEHFLVVHKALFNVTTQDLIKSVMWTDCATKAKAFNEAQKAASSLAHITPVPQQGALTATIQTPARITSNQQGPPDEGSDNFQGMTQHCGSIQLGWVFLRTRFCLLKKCQPATAVG